MIYNDLLNRIKVLIIHDKADVLDPVIKVLKNWGVNHSFVYDIGNSTLYIHKHSPDILLTGIMTHNKYNEPVYSVASQAGVPVIVLCGKQEVQRAIDLIAEGQVTSYFIHEPLYDPHRVLSLLFSVAEVMDAKRYKSELQGKFAYFKEHFFKSVLEEERRKLAMNFIRDFEMWLDEGRQLHHFNVSNEKSFKKYIDDFKQTFFNEHMNTFYARVVQRSVIDFDEASGEEGSMVGAQPLREYSHRTKTKSVLVVEDNEANMIIVSDVLFSKGYSVHQAKDGANGLKLAVCLKPDLIILDLGLPVLDGLELNQRLKAIEDTKEIPIIALTGRADQKTVKKCLDGGITDYIVKPYTMDTLNKKIEQMIG